MYRSLRWAVLLIGIVSIWFGGASLFGEPQAEVLYGGAAPIRSCATGGCIYIYDLTVGNTGRSVQENVRVQLKADVLDSAILRTKVRTFGVSDRDVRISDDHGVRSFDLGPMKPRERVELQWTLRYPPGQPPPSMDDTIVAVEAAQGEAKRGDPASTTLARVLWSVFGHLPW